MMSDDGIDIFDRNGNPRLETVPRELLDDPHETLEAGINVFMISVFQGACDAVWIKAFSPKNAAAGE